MGLFTDFLIIRGFMSLGGSDRRDCDDAKEAPPAKPLTNAQEAAELRRSQRKPRYATTMLQAFIFGVAINVALFGLFGLFSVVAEVPPRVNIPHAALVALAIAALPATVLAFVIGASKWKAFVDGRMTFSEGAACFAVALFTYSAPHIVQIAFMPLW